MTSGKLLGLSVPIFSFVKLGERRTVFKRSLEGPNEGINAKSLNDVSVSGAMMIIPKNFF